MIIVFVYPAPLPLPPLLCAFVPILLSPSPSSSSLSSRDHPSPLPSPPIPPSVCLHCSLCDARLVAADDVTALRPAPAYTNVVLWLCGKTPPFSKYPLVPMCVPILSFYCSPSSSYPVSILTSLPFISHPPPPFCHVYFFCKLSF